MLHDAPPLSIYVLWNENYPDGSDISNEIYKQLTRDVEDPLNRGIGIPVYFITESDDIFEVYEVSKSQKNVFILLVDDNMVVDKEWKDSVNKLVEKCTQNKESNLLLAIAITDNAYNLSEEISRINYIRVNKLETYKKKEERIIFSITHELCRFLYGVNRASEEVDGPASHSPVKLFISHAKEDGLDVAKEINQYIQNDTPLDAFFDANDITAGYDFESEIKDNIDNSVLLVIHSDKYSSREWCRKEILIAKKYNRPIVILNTLKSGEDRSFPYMANVRTIRISENINYEKVITKTLLETLRFVYQSKYISYISNVFKLDMNNKTVLSYPPELLSLAYISNEQEIDVVYPDPPLSDEEIDLFTSFVGEKRFITPALIPALALREKIGSDERILMSHKIGISISNNEDIKKYGFEYIHLQDSMNEVARYLLVIGCELVYGGDIHYKHDYNFVNSLFDLASTHNKENKEIPQKITNFVAYPLYEKIDVSDRAKLVKVATFREIKSVLSINGKKVTDQRIIVALNLSNMRNQMNEYIDARIIMGGKCRGFSGVYPGILEEASLALRSSKPLFIIGAFGGISKLLADLLTDQISEKEFIEKLKLGEEYESFKSEYNEFVENTDIESIDYCRVLCEIKGRGVEGLNNGLSKEENEKLFVTNNIIEVVTIILKGLCEIRRKGME